VTQARERLAAVEQRLDEYERAGAQARRSIGDLESQVSAALYQAGLTGEAASVDDLRAAIAQARQTSADSDVQAQGAKGAIAKARDELAHAVNASYKTLAAQRDAVAHELAAERADLEQRTAAHQHRVTAHQGAWQELLIAQGAEPRSLRRDEAGAVRLDDSYNPLDRLDRPNLKVA
jgi:chromosome segregation ATPase